MLVVHVQPDEGVSLAIGAKVPGQGLHLRTVHMDFLYGGAFRTELPEAYERLILDCLLGDATLFTRADEVDEQWALVDSIVAGWKQRPNPLPELRGGHLGAGRGGEADRAGREAVAPPLRDVSVAEIEWRLDELREHETTSQRTSVLTHTAWVPLEWARAAGRVLEGMGARVPSRTILLHPDPDASETRLDALAEHECFPTGGHETCAETARIWLRGETAKAPASVVAPLQIADLPAFLRWRGRLPFGSPVLEQLVECHDRLIVDSSEWGDRLAPAYRRLPELVRPHRRLRPRLGARASVPGGARRPLALRGEGAPRRAARAPTPRCSSAWLRSRLKKDVKLRREDARELRSVEVDGVPVRVRRRHMRSASDLLSDELEVFARDPIYEAAVRSV